MRMTTILLGLLLFAAAPTGRAVAGEFPKPQIEYAPRTFHCPYAEVAPVIDGLGTDRIWQNCGRTDSFVDIEGKHMPTPWFETRAAMAWDDDYFYVFAQMEEPHVWGKLQKRDSVIYYDNDFEVFIDPDGDTHNYFELEINALGTEWDLFLTRPYRDGAQALHAWDIPGLKTAVHIDGTLNDPTDTDTGWNVEIAIPWGVLAEASGTTCPPEDGDRWWVNFSRVEWDMEVVDGEYIKAVDPETGNTLPEHNWVWSPQGLIAMHYPERWGIVQFSAEPPQLTEPEVEVLVEDFARIALYEIYYLLREYQGLTGTYNGFWEDPAWQDTDLSLPWPIELSTSDNRFEIIIGLRDGTTLSVTEDGRLHRRNPGDA